jgi:hypothetical protein
MPSGSIPLGHCFPIGVRVELFDNFEELPNKSTLTLIVQYLVTGAGAGVKRAPGRKRQPPGPAWGPAPGGAGGAGGAG